MSGCGCGCTNDRTALPAPCDCCTGTGQAMIAAPANPAGLDALQYRIGTHPSFLDAMIARLSRADAPALAGLRTRDPGDASIALLDAWALVADVLTFYQERIANEGYLRTATERRSVLELSALIGYTPRPGVSASAFLAYTLEKDSAPVTILPATRASSVPAPGEQMQMFETADALEARVEWNRLAVRVTESQTAASIAAKGLYLKGTALNLKPNDPLLIDLADTKGLRLMRIDRVEVDFDLKRTRVVLRDAASLSPQEKVRQIVARFSRIDDFEVSADAAMTKRVLALLEEAAAVADREPRSLRKALNETLLPKLDAELETARERHFTKLEPWIDAIVDGLRDVTAAATPDVPPREAAKSRTENPQALALGNAVTGLKLAASVPPAGSQQLARDAGQAFRTTADTLPRMLASLQPALRKTLYAVVKSLPPTPALSIEIHAMRVSAAPFGHNAPLRVTDLSNNIPIFGEWQIDDPLGTGSDSNGGGGDANGGGIPVRAAGTATHHAPDVLFLDNDYTMSPSSLVAIETPGRTTVIMRSATTVVARSLAAYGLSGKTMELTLPAGQPWLTTDGEVFATVRNTRVFTGSELLELDEVPIETPIAGAEIELDRVYEDLEPGRWAIVTGERADLPGPDGLPLTGVKAGELVMLAAVAQRRRTSAQGEQIPGDRTHTFLTLAAPLAYTYTRTTVVVYGNVVRATNGETVQEVLGSGDASTSLQRFMLKRPPLTYVSASTVSGVSSTLQVRVNQVLWHEARSLASLTPADRSFVTRTDDDAKTSVIFGTGERGARVPTGTENVTAIYRTGIGKGGNVIAGQISLLTSRPLGVKEVTNPLRASGGADRESRDQARRNAPLAVAALDRLVSMRDYADFSRTFAGIGKAAAVRLTDGRRRFVHVTIAGANDIPIEPSSDLYRNLGTALRQFGDPYLPIRIEVRERLALVISANVKLLPDYAWEFVEPRIRTALLTAFGYERIDLGRDLLLADALVAVQRIAGVAYVDVDVFDAISETQLLAGFAEQQAQTLARKDRLTIEPAGVAQGVVRAAQIAYLSPDVPDTLILQEIES